VHKHPQWRLGLPTIYIFLALTVILLVNMLIAIMSKTFDSMWESQSHNCLQLFASYTVEWKLQASAPPPLSLLSLPSALVDAIRQAWSKACGVSDVSYVQMSRPSKTPKRLSPSSLLRPVALEESRHLTFDGSLSYKFKDYTVDASWFARLGVALTPEQKKDIQRANATALATMWPSVKEQTEQALVELVRFFLHSQGAQGSGDDERWRVSFSKKLFGVQTQLARTQQTIETIAQQQKELLSRFEGGTPPYEQLYHEVTDVKVVAHPRGEV